jgi:ABC-type glutathione transport system ATPase component
MLYVSHDTAELCDQLLFLEGGRLVTQSNPKKMQLR